MVLFFSFYETLALKVRCLMNLLSAKLDGYLPGLRDLEKARGISSTVEPLFLPQYKWTTGVFKLKKKMRYHFPHCCSFLRLLGGKPKQEMTQASFQLLIIVVLQRQKDPYGPLSFFNRKTSVTVHKTYVSAKAKSKTNSLKI